MERETMKMMMNDCRRSRTETLKERMEVEEEMGWVGRCRNAGKEGAFHGWW